MTDIHQTRLLDSLKSLFKSGKYSDLTICCGAHEFKVHRAIICQRSQFFAAACNGQFQEAATGRILLGEDDPSAVERMLCYLYTLDYDDASSSSPVDSGSCSGDHVAEAVVGDADGPASDAESHGAESDTGEPSTELPDQDNLSTVSGGNQDDPVPTAEILFGNIQVYSIADKYDIPELKELAKSKFLVQAHHLLSIDLYPEMIKLIYESTPSSDRGLRDAVSLACVEEIRTLVNDPIFSALLRDVGDFGIDVLYESLKSDGERLDQILASKTALEDEMEEIRSELEKHGLERDQYKEQLQQVIKVMNGHGNCRHCDVDFNGRLDGDDPTTLRCGKCRTRHR